MLEAHLSATTAELDSARQLPRALYLDPELLRLERRAILERSWWPAGHADDLPQPGDWARALGPSDALVLVRGADLAVRALHDVCRHRGVLLLDGERGRCPRLELVCPYHAWAYDLAGGLLRAPGMPGSFACAEHGLLTARVAERLGHLFVAVRPDTPPLEDGHLPPWLAALDPALLRRVRRRSWVTAANWKLVVENFQESHHFPTIHPGLERLTPARRSTSDTRGPRWLGGTMTLAPGAETVSLSGRVGRRPLLVPEAERHLVRDALVLPGLLTSLQPDYLLTYRLFPLAVDRTEVVAEIFFHAATPPDEAGEDVLAFWDRTNAEDRAICERQQRGLACRALDRAPPPGYALSEDGVHAFDRWLAGRLLEEVSR